MCNDLFDIPAPTLAPAKGVLLVASPLSDGEIFKKSVILLTEHNDDGSIGFILNKKTDFKVSDVIPDIQAFDANVLIGGPVSPSNLFFIHRKPTIPQSYHIRDNLYWMGDFEALTSQINSNLISPAMIKFFFGYSGWSKGQLEAEIKNNFWLLASPKKYDLWKDDHLWEHILTDLGLDERLLRTIPENPSLN